MPAAWPHPSRHPHMPRVPTAGLGSSGRCSLPPGLGGQMSSMTSRLPGCPPVSPQGAAPAGLGWAGLPQAAPPPHPQLPGDPAPPCLCASSSGSAPTNSLQVTHQASVASRGLGTSGKSGAQGSESPNIHAKPPGGTSRPQSCPEASSELGMYQLFWRPQAKVSTSVPSGAGEATPGQASSSQLLEHPESDGLTRSRNPIS
ncbi:B3 domain-containing protein LFL1-like [Pteropus medius]|uniref:B3 domain-containing protein LFL1-like n=1 Tax=Pteropus vampyrus TaxID=132908 RepID=UPI00196B2A5E|nr:B3 domain-containing protein LFL1-like [Pteropus giganteus]